MANPFKEAEKKQKVAPGGTPKPHVEEEQPVVEQKKDENPLAGMIEQKETGKTYAFYLSSEAADKLESLAKQNKCSKSKALDALLRSL